MPMNDHWIERAFPLPFPHAHVTDRVCGMQLVAFLDELLRSTAPHHHRWQMTEICLGALKIAGRTDWSMNAVEQAVERAHCYSHPTLQGMTGTHTEAATPLFIPGGDDRAPPPDQQEDLVLGALFAMRDGIAIALAEQIGAVKNRDQLHDAWSKGPVRGDPFAQRLAEAGLSALLQYADEHRKETDAHTLVHTAAGHVYHLVSEVVRGPRARDETTEEVPVDAVEKKDRKPCKPAALEIAQAAMLERVRELQTSAAHLPMQFMSFGELREQCFRCADEAVKSRWTVGHFPWEGTSEATRNMFFLQALNAAGCVTTMNAQRAFESVLLNASSMTFDAELTEE